VRSLRLATFVALIALVLPACGGSNSPSASGGGGSRADKEPMALLRDVAAALRHVHSYHFDATTEHPDGHGVINADVARDGKVRYKADTDGRRFEVIAAGTRVYMRANAAFWRRNGGERLAGRLAGRWVRVPAQRAGGITAVLDPLKPSRLAFCMTQPSGTLEIHGTAKVGGKQAVAILSKGDRPGTAPGALYVQARGPALLLRSVQTGPARPGGNVDPRCDSHGSSITKADIRLSRFDMDVTIRIPKHVLDLDKLAGGGRTV
jgi:hypothetical protein